MKWRPYRKYKDSGVEWLGQVPEGWEIRRVRHLFEIRKRICGSEGYQVLSITQQGIKVKDTESGDGQLAADYSKYQFVEVGDFAMNHMDLLTGYVDVSRLFGITSPDYRVFGLRDRSASCDRYYLYLFQNGYRSRIFFAYGQGSSQLGRWRFPADEFNKFLFPYPPAREQQKIAAFLDHEVGKINDLIAKQELLIELLEEKRQALISRAVTKGLNPDASMKPSGVEWLGDVPVHWDVVRLGRKLELQRGVDITKDAQSAGEIPVVSSGGISSFHNRAIAAGPGVIVGRKGTAGAVYYVESDYWPHDTTLWVKDFRGNHPRYIYYKLCAMDLGSYDTGSANPTLNRNVIHPVFVSWPPRPEQQAIADALDRLCGQIDSLVGHAKRAISLLRERRTALISAAVTGKIDVREAVHA